MKRKKIAVCGLGSFGKESALRLQRYGHVVTLYDSNSKRLDELKDLFEDVNQADVSEDSLYKEQNFRNFDAVILDPVNGFEKQLLALSYLKDFTDVYTITDSDVHRKILYRLGAKSVGQPATDAAVEITGELMHGKVKNFYESKGFVVAGAKLPESMDGKNLVELNLRSRYQITVLLVKQQESDWHPPHPDEALNTGDELLVFGNHLSIDELFG